MAVICDNLLPEHPPLQTMCKSRPRALPENDTAGAGAAIGGGSSFCNPSRSSSGCASASMAACNMLDVREAVCMLSCRIAIP